MLPLIISLAALVACDVHIAVDSVEPREYSFLATVSSAKELFNKSFPNELYNGYGSSSRVIMSSFTQYEPTDVTFFDENSMFSSSSSFVHGAIDAWANHQRLVLRPDVVWFEILTQMRLYMSVHEKELYEVFVRNDRHVEALLSKADGWESTFRNFATLIHRYSRAHWLLDWVMPSFSTSSHNDEIAAAVLMMGAMEHYHVYTAKVTCGLPAVSLLGVRADWYRLLEKLDRFEEFGREAFEYADKLRPILGGFVSTFDRPDDDRVRAFWSDMVRVRQTNSHGRDKRYEVSGWIVGFAHWDVDGKRKKGVTEVPLESTKKYLETQEVVVDGVHYGWQYLASLYASYAKVPIKTSMWHGGHWVEEVYLVAGNIGIERERPGGFNKFTSLKPLSNWFAIGPVELDSKTGPSYGSVDALWSLTDDVTVCRSEDQTMADVLVALCQAPLRVPCGNIVDRWRNGVRGY